MGAGKVVVEALRVIRGIVRCTRQAVKCSDDARLPGKIAGGDRLAQA